MPSFTFDWFGTPVRIESNRGAFLHHLKATFPSAPEHLTRPRRLRYNFRPARAGARHLLRRRHLLELDPRRPEAHAYHVLLADLLARTDRLFVLHGLALARDGRSLVVSAPSGFGKTTLAVHLAQRGFDLLTDDLVGIERATGRVMPCPKALGLRPGTRRGLPAGLGARARRARTAVTPTGGEWSVDPVALFGRIASPVSPAMLVVMRPAGTEPGARSLPLMHLRFAPGHRPPLGTLRGIPGVADAWADRSDQDLLCVRFTEGSGLDHYVRLHRKVVVLAYKRPAEGPRFDQPPRIWPIGPFQAAIEAGQEMVNRGHGSLVEREFRGHEPDLVLELGGLLRGCRCYAMTPGRLDATLDLLQSRFAAVCA
jgi:hypothetical protein